MRPSTLTKGGTRDDQHGLMVNEESYWRRVNLRALFWLLYRHRGGKSAWIRGRGVGRWKGGWKGDGGRDRQLATSWSGWGNWWPVSKEYAMRHVNEMVWIKRVVQDSEIVTFRQVGEYSKHILKVFPFRFTVGDGNFRLFRGELGPLLPPASPIRQTRANFPSPYPKAMIYGSF